MTPDEMMRALIELTTGSGTRYFDARGWLEWSTAPDRERPGAFILTATFTPEVEGPAVPDRARWLLSPLADPPPPGRAS